ncbi:MAG: cation-transporting P-type ATPase, partial [Comamonadaceae bacterium]|nr:cation-transporting P-type ATPase [Comamonadaceae bacterium]
MTTWFGNFLRRRRSKGLFSRSALPSFTRRADGKSDMASAQVSEHVSCALWRAACDDVPATLVRLRSSESGLTQQEAEERLERHGPNEVDHEKPLAWWQHLWQCYSNPFNILLTVLALVSAATDDMEATVVIGCMVLLSTVIRFVQEGRSHRSAERLKAMVSSTAAVLRVAQEGTAAQQMEVPMRELVPGDHIVLSAGDMVPADCRVISAKDLFVAQAA